MRHIEIYNEIQHRWEEAPSYIEMDPELANGIDKMVDIFEDEPSTALYRVIDLHWIRIYDIPEVIKMDDHDAFNDYYNDPQPTTEEIIEIEFLAEDLREFARGHGARDCLFYLAGIAPSMPISEAVNLVNKIVGGVR